MGTPLNPINVRLPQFDLTTEDGRQAAHRYVASGIVDLNQAIAALHGKVSSIKPVTTTIIQTSGGGGGSSVVIGGVNDQLGQNSYTTQQSDYGTKIIVGDSSPVTVNLNSGVTTPWFTIIDNDSSSYASLVGPVVGAQSIYPGGFAVVYFDGANFYSGSVQVATDSSLGVVRPDNRTIFVDSGILSVPIALDSSLGLVIPDGNTIVVDSTSGLLRTNGITANITTAALTSLGTQGSMKFVDGLLISQTPAT